MPTPALTTGIGFAASGVCVLASIVAFQATAACAQTVAAYKVEGDGISGPLDGLQGDARRGRAIVLDRRSGNCLICHVVPEPNEPFMGSVGPDLRGVGQKLTAAQIRLRMVDSTQINPRTVMPPYHRVAGLVRVGAGYEGKPVLTAQELEDVVAYLVQLRP